MTRTITINGAPPAEVVDFRIIPGKRTLVLFICEQGVYSTRRIKLNVPDAGLFALNPMWGNAMFTRGTGTQKAGRGCPNLVGVYACARHIAESLSVLLWGKQNTYPDWQEPTREGVQVAQSHLNAAD